MKHTLTALNVLSQALRSVLWPVASRRAGTVTLVALLFVAIVAAAVPASAQLGGPDSVALRRGDGFPGSARSGERLGRVLAVGDFNGDGFDDVAAGIPDADVDGLDSAGVVAVAYGGGTGVSSLGAQEFTQSVQAPQAGPEKKARFGSALAVGDFNGDLYDDLAIGASQANLPGVQPNPIQGELGAVSILLGSKDGLRKPLTPLTFRPQFEDDTTLYFGTSLASGDFNGDGLDDLAIGASGTRAGASGGSNGEVEVHFGSQSDILSRSVVQRFHGQRRAALARRLAVGDFNGDGFDDLAMSGVDMDAQNGTPAIGGVFVVGGSPRGLIYEYPVLSQERFDIQGQPQQNSDFGEQLAVGDFDADGFDDLAIAATNEDYGGQGEGVVHVVFGNPETGLAGIDQALFAEDIPALFDARVQFGLALTAADFDGNGYDDLAVGLPYDRGFQFLRPRSAVLISGGRGLLLPKVAQRVDRGTPGVPGSVTSSDAFGSALAAGDFNGGGVDLAIGSFTAGTGGEVVIADNVAVGQPDSGIRLSNNRFSVNVAWRDFAGNRGYGQGVLQSADSALFYFFDGANWELMIKVLDACSFSGHFWTFLAATTDVEFTVTVRDTETGAVREYFNKLGKSADAVTDTKSFATCG